MNIMDIVKMSDEQKAFMLAFMMNTPLFNDALQAWEDRL